MDEKVKAIKERAKHFEDEYPDSDTMGDDIEHLLSILSEKEKEIGELRVHLRLEMEFVNKRSKQLMEAEARIKDLEEKIHQLYQDGLNDGLAH